MAIPSIGAPFASMERRLSKLPRYSRRAAICIGLMTGISAAVWLGYAAVLREAARFWVISENIDQPADAIFVLGGGVDILPVAAADLYKRDLASRILLSNSGGNPAMALGDEFLNANLNRKKLIKLGVPSDAIEIVGSNLSSTYEEAVAVLQWAEANHAVSLIVPTELFHSRRVRWIFHRELSPAHVQVRVMALQHARYSADDWWRYEQGVSGFINEIVKYVFYRLKY